MGCGGGDLTNVGDGGDDDGAGEDSADDDCGDDDCGDGDRGGGGGDGDGGGDCTIVGDVDVFAAFTGSLVWCLASAELTRLHGTELNPERERVTAPPLNVGIAVQNPLNRPVKSCPVPASGCSDTKLSNPPCGNVSR